MPSSIHASASTEAQEEAASFAELAWDQFRRRRVAMASLWGVVGLLLAAVYAPLLASNKPFLWRVDDGALESPWLASLVDRNFYENGVDVFFNVAMVSLTVLVLPTLRMWRRARSRTRRRRVLTGAAALFGVALVGVFSWPTQSAKQVHPRIEARLIAEGHDVLAVYPPLAYSFRDGDLSEVRAPISMSHPLGTDSSGRDVFTRLLFGTRISLTIGFFAVALYVGFGTVVGAIAGFYGGRIDLIIVRIIEVVLSVPTLFVVLTVASFIEERSIFHIMVIIAAVAWTTPARLVRGEFLRLRELDFVTAARASGYGEAAIIFREILPNALGPVLVAATFGVARAILIESTMSFLGLGDITVPSWGSILNTGRTTGIWTLILAPGAAIFVTVSLLNLVGEGIRDALDPKLRK